MYSILQSSPRSFVTVLFMAMGLYGGCWTGSSQEVGGTYQVVYDTSNSYQSYTLELQQDNTFRYHFYRKNDCNSCKEENYYGRGTWHFEKKKLYLSTTPEDLDEAYTLNLDGSQAHYIQKSARDKTDKVVPTRLKFFKSQIPWVKGKELLKK